MKAKKERRNPMSSIKSARGITAEERRAIEYVFTKHAHVLDAIDRGVRASGRNR